MKKYWIIQRIIAIILVIAIVTPLALAGGGSKHFKKGRKFEAAEQWDLAAEQYALALSEDPGNPEYKLHLLRSLSRASLTFMERGKTLAEQGDYEGAYQAFRQAYSYDNSNEMALARMKTMLEKLGISNEGADSFGNDDLKKTSLSNDTSNSKNVALSISNFRPQNFSFRDAPATVIINTIAKQAKLNVVYDDQAVRIIESKTKVNFELEGVSAPKALEIFLSTQRYAFAPITRRTIVIFQDVALNRQKYEDLLIRTFYIKNAVAKDIAQPLQQALTVPGTGKPVQIIPIDKLNALVVRETKENLALIETMLERLDKPQSEVVMDVNLYEVTDNALVQIGNQLLSSTANRNIGLDSLGGIGQNSIRRISPGGIFDSTLGIALSVPNSTISLLQSKSVGKLVASTQIRAFEGENASVNIGSRVPIRSATIPTGTVVTTGQGQGQGQGQNQFNFPGSVGGVEQITYENVGLNIEISKPTVLNDYVQMMFQIESSSVVPDPDPQRRSNPTFTQRKVKGTTRIKEGETSIVTSVMRLDKSEGASGIPILSFIPIAGRFFATPNNNSMSTNIVVTVTPHVLRAPNVSESDLAMLSVNTLTLEQMVAMADILDQQEAEQKAKQNPQQNNPQNNPQRSASPQNNLPVQGVNQKPVQPTSNVTRPVNNSSQPLQNNVAPIQNPPPAPVDTTSAIPSNNTPNAENNSNAEAENNQEATSTSPVTVMARVLNPEIKSGQTGLIAIVLSSSNVPMLEANFALRFNPSVIKVTAVRDGGVMSLSGATAEFNYSDGGDTVIVNARRPSGAGPVPAFGQLALIYFQAVGAGSADLNLSEAQLIGGNGQSLLVTLVNSNVEVKADVQPNPGGNDGNTDDDDEEEDE